MDVSQLSRIFTIVDNFRTKIISGHVGHERINDFGLLGSLDHTILYYSFVVGYRCGERLLPQRLKAEDSTRHRQLGHENHSDSHGSRLVLEDAGQSYISKWLQRRKGKRKNDNS
jgi:hypothetical protein